MQSFLYRSGFSLGAFAKLLQTLEGGLTMVTLLGAFLKPLGAFQKFPDNIGSFPVSSCSKRHLNLILIVFNKDFYANYISNITPKHKTDLPFKGQVKNDSPSSDRELVLSKMYSWGPIH